MKCSTGSRRGALIVLAAATLTMGGCCDKCGKQLLQALKAAYLMFASNAAQCCNRLTPEIADACIGERQDVFDDAGQLALAAKTACDQGDQQLMNTIIDRLLDRLPNPDNAATTMSRSMPVQTRSGQMVNALPLLACGERVTIVSVATAAGQWTPKTTAIFDGREVLPEAAGNAAVSDEQAERRHGGAITEV